jgi:hypothetical protein
MSRATSRKALFGAAGALCLVLVALYGGRSDDREIAMESVVKSTSQAIDSVPEASVTVDASAAVAPSVPAVSVQPDFVSEGFSQAAGHSDLERSITYRGNERVINIGTELDADDPDFVEGSGEIIELGTFLDADI